MAPFLLLTSSIGKTCGVRAKSVDRGSVEQGSSDIYSNSPVHGVDTGSSDSDSNAVNSAATGSSNRDGGLGPGVGDTESSNSDSIENNVTSREPFASNEYSRVTNNLVETYAKNNSEALTELDFEDCTALTNRALCNRSLLGFARSDSPILFAVPLRLHSIDRHPGWCKISTISWQQT